MSLTNGWHLDKRVPIGFLVGIIMQTGAFAWWASNLSSRVDSLEATRAQQYDRGERLTRVETSVENIEHGLDRIETKIDRWMGRMGK